MSSLTQRKLDSRLQRKGFQVNYKEQSGLYATVENERNAGNSTYRTHVATIPSFDENEANSLLESVAKNDSQDKLDL